MSGKQGSGEENNSVNAAGRLSVSNDQKEEGVDFGRSQEVQNGCVTAQVFTFFMRQEKIVQEECKVMKSYSDGVVFLWMPIKLEFQIRDNKDIFVLAVSMASKFNVMPTNLSYKRL